ncbi:hypothetical protein PNOK_0403700 [Pyrrhoderma noxium]|uniref:F-box domain-containing protein n=1 Tax=Pyrrhoderma noxium TaxID=2282107 RepID=A0A286UPB2_9AGAM|nr:hypothetical protein PNOK_0403700 [Pyrrhoderma noxium]
MSSGYIWQPTESTNRSLKFPKVIDGLPDELLVEIIKWSLDDPDTSPGILRISLLNRRFRFIALNTPSLWTKVPRIGGEFYKSFIKRSKGRPLDVTIKIKESYNPYEIEELDSILSSTSTERWRTVIILCAREYIITNEKFVEQRISPLTALHKLRKLKLPSLETLRYSLYGPVAVSYSCFYESEGSLQVTRDWEAPKLKNMTIEGLIPFPFAKTMDSITDVTINVDGAYTEDIQFVNRTTNHFLISVPSIKSLRLIVTSPIVDKNVYDDLPVGYRKNRIDSNSRTSSADGDDNYPTQVANESKLTHDSLYEHLTMGEDIYTSENIDNEAKRLAERNDIKLVNRLENVAMDSLCFIPARLDKLKYLEFDLDPLYDIYNLIPAYLRLSTPNVEELVFKINIPRGKRVYTLGSKTKWGGFTIEDVNLVLKYLLLNNKQHIFSGSRLPNLKHLFISVDECNDYSRGGTKCLKCLLNLSRT